MQDDTHQLFCLFRCQSNPYLRPESMRGPPHPASPFSLPSILSLSGKPSAQTSRFLQKSKLGYTSGFISHSQSLSASFQPPLNHNFLSLQQSRLDLSRRQKSSQSKIEQIVRCIAPPKLISSVNCAEGFRYFYLREYSSALFHFKLALTAAPQHSEYAGMLQINLCIILALQRVYTKAITRLCLLYNKHTELDSHIIQAIGFCLLKMCRMDDFFSLYSANSALFEERGYSEIASILAKQEQIRVQGEQESSLERRLRQAFFKNNKNKASLPSLLSPEQRQRLGKVRQRPEQNKATSAEKKQLTVEGELKRFVKEFRALTAKGLAQSCSEAHFKHNLDEYIDRQLYATDESGRTVQLTEEELEILRSSMQRKMFLTSREHGVLDKMLKQFALFHGQESCLRRVVFDLSKYRVVSQGRKVGEAMMAVSSEQYDAEIAEMLGDDILENEERLAYLLVSGEVLYCVKKPNQKYVMLEKILPGNLFFSHPRIIESKLVGSSLQYYTELKAKLKGGGTLCALAKTKCELLEIDLDKYKEEIGLVLKKEVRERMTALRKNPLLGQLSQECLLTLAFLARVEQIHYGEFIVKQKMPQRECVLVLKGSCDVVYANVLDSLTLSDFRKYSDTRQLTTRDIPPQSSGGRSFSTLGKRSKSNSTVRGYRTIFRASPPTSQGVWEGLDQEDEEWRKKLRFTFWDNEKKGQLGQGDGTGYSCFISEGNQGLQAPLFQFIPLHPETTTQYSLIGSSTAVKVMRITPEELMGVEAHAMEIQSLLKWYSKYRDHLKDALV